MSDNSWDKDWLVFSRKSRRGIFVLLFIFIVVAVLPRIYRNHFMDNPLDVQIASLSLKEKESVTPEFENEFTKQSKDIKKQNQKQKAFTYNIPSNPFDPNEYSFEDWKAIGFSDKQVHTILNYQQSGGEFKVKEDVKKLYVVDDNLYSKLYDLIDLPDSIGTNKNRNSTRKPKVKRDIQINVNTATIEQLKEVEGIGPFFAEEIVKLREGYGGIHDLNQLLEIYRMDEEKLSLVKENFIIKRADIKKININKATRKELNNHKEISWNVANSIVSMRETHGQFKRIDDLLKSVLIDQKKLKKLKPYLTIE